MGPSRDHHPGPAGPQDQARQLRGRAGHAHGGRSLRADGRARGGHGGRRLPRSPGVARRPQGRGPDLDGRRDHPTRRREGGGGRSALSRDGGRRGLRPQGRGSPRSAPAPVLSHRQGQGGSPFRHRAWRGLRRGVLRAVGLRHPGNAQVPPRSAGEPAHHRQARAGGDRGQSAGHPRPRGRGDGGARRSGCRGADRGSAHHPARRDSAGPGGQGAGHRGHPDAGVDGDVFAAHARGGERRRHRHLRGRGCPHALRRNRLGPAPGGGGRGHVAGGAARRTGNAAGLHSDLATGGLRLPRGGGGGGLPGRPGAARQGDRGLHPVGLQRAPHLLRAPGRARDGPHAVF